MINTLRITIELPAELVQQALAVDLLGDDQIAGLLLAELQRREQAAAFDRITAALDALPDDDKPDPAAIVDLIRASR